MLGGGGHGKFKTRQTEVLSLAVALNCLESAPHPKSNTNDSVFNFIHLLYVIYLNYTWN